MLTANEIALDAYRHGALTDPARTIKPYTPSRARESRVVGLDVRWAVRALKSARASLPYAGGWAGRMWAATCVW